MPDNKRTASGWRMVPEEITDEVREALSFISVPHGATLNDMAEQIYSAVLCSSAAPHPPEPRGGTYREGYAAGVERSAQITEQYVGVAGLTAAIREGKGPLDSAEVFPQPQRKDGEEPCGECHLHEGETCDICGAARFAPPSAEQSEDAGEPVPLDWREMNRLHNAAHDDLAARLAEAERTNKAFSEDRARLKRELVEADAKLAEAERERDAVQALYDKSDDLRRQQVSDAAMHADEIRIERDAVTRANDALRKRVRAALEAANADYGDGFAAPSHALAAVVAALSDSTRGDGDV